MSASATMWPPSCHAALLWSTPTPRTSQSLTKETGWSDGDQRDGGKKAALATKDKRVQVPPLPKPPHSTPRHQRVLSTLERSETSLLPTFPLSSFFISSYLRLVVVCVRRRSSPSPSSVSLVFQEKFLHSFFSALPRDLVSAGFLVMKSPMFTIVIHENNFFEEPRVFVSYLYVDVKKKGKKIKKNTRN